MRLSKTSRKIYIEVDNKARQCETLHADKADLIHDVIHHDNINIYYIYYIYINIYIMMILIHHLIVFT